MLYKKSLIHTEDYAHILMLYELIRLYLSDFQVQYLIFVIISLYRHKQITKEKIIMKMDIEYIKEILTQIEEIDAVTIYSGDLKKAMNISDKNTSEEQKFIKHIWDLRDLGAIEGRTDTMGFCQTAQGHWIHHGDMYRLTPWGQQLLDVMRNDNWWSHIKSMGKSITKETLRQAPSIVLAKVLS